LQKVEDGGADLLCALGDGVRPWRTEIPAEPDHGGFWKARHGLAHHGPRPPLVARNDQEAGAERPKGTRIKAGWTDERQRRDAFWMRLHEARDIRQHGDREVGPFDPHMAEYLCQTVGYGKICSCCHTLASSPAFADACLGVG
jgi:hypothetical protein